VFYECQATHFHEAIPILPGLFMDVSSGWIPCSAGWTVPHLARYWDPPPDGDYALEARAVSLVTGIPDPTPIKKLFSLGPGASPETTTTTLAHRDIDQATASMDFASPKAENTFECRADSAGWSPCSSPHTFSRLTSGEHTLEARAVNPNGDPDESPARVTVTVASPRVIVQPIGPQPEVESRATLMFSSSNPVASFECATDGGSWTACSSPHTFSGLADGVHTLSIQGSFGGVTGPAVDTPVRVDTTTVPSAVLGASRNPASTGEPVLLDASGSADRRGGQIVDYAWDLDGDQSYETHTSATPTVITSYATTGTRTASVRVTDHGGLTATAALPIEVRLASPAGALGVSIDQGEHYTNDPHVTVSVRWPKLATSLVISNDGGFEPSSTFAIAPHAPWVLDESGAERLPKTIYVRFAGGEAGRETYQDDIILDQTPPSISAASISSGGAALRAFAATRKKPAKLVKVTIKAKDATSGVDAVQLAVSRKRPSGVRKFARSLSVAGPAPKYVRVRDRAGNFSAWKKLRAKKPKR
jgi:hypothetical protein